MRRFPPLPQHPAYFFLAFIFFFSPSPPLLSFFFYRSKIRKMLGKLGKSAPKSLSPSRLWLPPHFFPVGEGGGLLGVLGGLGVVLGRLGNPSPRRPTLAIREPPAPSPDWPPTPPPPPQPIEAFGRGGGLCPAPRRGGGGHFTPRLLQTAKLTPNFGLTLKKKSGAIYLLFPPLQTAN